MWHSSFCSFVVYVFVQPFSQKMSNPIVNYVLLSFRVIFTLQQKRRKSKRQFRLDLQEGERIREGAKMRIKIYIIANYSQNIPFLKNASCPSTTKYNNNKVIKACAL